eukprot:TRINITY_DN35171_c0_g1_i1.p1 TRINITY_DN35171_c0_g1~~TRINITY_DN35171_c0_g1_i1.p1  ORF type:complete len:948 (+),score=140.38 TRINITY_DN35171_c0_g1_i1:135-2846(+)
MLPCWFGALTFETCCSGEYYVGNPRCWDATFTYERCCLPELDRLNLSVASVDTTNAEVIIQIADPKDNQTAKTINEQARALLGNAAGTVISHASIAGLLVSNEAGSPLTMQRRKCMTEFDTANYRRWFYSQSGVPTLPVAANGNGLSCVLGGHKYWWVAAEVQQALIDMKDDQWTTSSTMSRNFEFGMCLPYTCDYGIVEFLLVPFFLGPYLNKPWGQGPVWTENLVNSGEAPSIPRVEAWATEIFKTEGYMQKHWPIRTAVWEYQAEWFPSRGVLLWIGGAVLPLALAGLWSCIAGSGEDRGAEVAASSADTVSSSSHRLPSAAAAMGAKLRGILAPQTYLQRLWCGRGDDSAALHIVKVILQILVCWQHAFLLIEWYGHEGHIGISVSAPWTYGVAHCLGRVNTCFACVSAHLVVHSISKLLASRKTHPAPAIARWCARRWMAQVMELGIWSFYYLRVAPEIPWRPFPELVQVWYHARIQTCRAWPLPGRGRGLPMWVISALLVYEPVNAIMGWFDHTSTMCHNLPIFETLFSLSCIVAATAAVKHCFGFRAFVSTVVLLCAVVTARMPYSDPYGASGGDGTIGGHGDGRWQVLPATVLRLLPASLASALLSAAAESGALPALLAPWRGDVPEKSRTRLWCLAFGLIMVTFVFDFLLWAQFFIANNWRIAKPMLKMVVEAWQAVMKLSVLRPPFVQRLLTLAFEAPQVLGLSLIIHLGRQSGGASKSGNAASVLRGPQDDWLPSWVRVLSRLSLSINISNIFVLHYVTARLHDYPVEFSWVHLTVYTLIAWLSGAVLSLAAHLVAAPYTVLLQELVGYATGFVGCTGAVISFGTPRRFLGWACSIVSRLALRLSSVTAAAAEAAAAAAKDEPQAEVSDDGRLSTSGGASKERAPVRGKKHR